MNTICRDIFRAIHEEKWLSLEYRNGQGGAFEIISVNSELL